MSDGGFKISGVQPGAGGYFAKLPGAAGTVGQAYRVASISGNVMLLEWYTPGSGGVELGETDETAYRGDRGKTAYDHSQLATGNPHSVTASDVGLGNVENAAASSLYETIANVSTLSDAVDGAAVWITTDIAGTNTIAGTLYTTAMGVTQAFMLDAGTYYVWVQRAGINFTNPTEITVA